MPQDETPQKPEDISDILAELEKSPEVIESQEEVIIQESVIETEIIAETLETPAFELNPKNPIIFPTKLAEQRPICSFCTETAYAHCRKCHRSMCKHHNSRFDINECYDCSPNPQDKIRADFKVEPLVDDEGVTHTGQRITPVGDTFIFTSYIDTLTDDELLGMVGEYQDKIKDAQKLLYSRIIVHQTLTGAVTERERKKRLSNRGARIVINSQGEKKLVIPKTAKVKAQTASSPNPVELMKELSKTPEGKEKLKAILMGLIGKK